jgi:hypothetical protein
MRCRALREDSRKFLSRKTVRGIEAGLGIMSKWMGDPKKIIN